MKNYIAITSLTVALAMGLLLISGCKDSNPVETEEEESEQQVHSYSGTQSPGDFWQWNLNHTDQTFTAIWDNQTLTDTTDDVTISGTFETLPSEFLKMNIGDATPDHPDVPEDGTAFMYGLELPGMALVVKPEGSIKGDVIINVDRSDCDDIFGTYNYINVSLAHGYNLRTNDAYGTVTFSNSSGMVSVNGTKNSLDCVLGDTCSVSGTIDPPPPFSCNGDGSFDVMTGSSVTARGQLTPSGGFIIDNGVGEGGIFGLKSDPSILDSDIGNRDYVGVVLEGEESFPVKIDFSSSLEARGIPITDVERNTLDTTEAAPLTITSFGNGQVTGFLTQEDRSTGNLVEFEIVGTFTQNGNQRALGMTGVTNDDIPFFVLLFSDGE